MNVTRIGPKTTTTLEAIRAALLERRESKTISELTTLQTLDALDALPKGTGKKSLRGRISTLQDQTQIPNLKESLIDCGIRTEKLKDNRPVTLTEDSQSATQRRDQIQAFEMILVGDLEGITIEPLSAGILSALPLKDFIKLHMDTILDDPRKIPLFYVPQAEISFDNLGLEPGEIAELRLYLDKRDEMLAEQTLEVNSSSKPFLLDDLHFLKDPVEDFLVFVNREITCPIKTVDTAERAVSEIDGSGIRFDINAAGRISYVSTYLTFKELQANFSSGV
jgi:hypothetical protein